MTDRIVSACAALSPLIVAGFVIGLCVLVSMIPTN